VPRTLPCEREVAVSPEALPAGTLHSASLSSGLLEPEEHVGDAKQRAHRKGRPIFGFCMW